MRKPKSPLDEPGQHLWALWERIDQHQKVKPQYRDTAKSHIDALSSYIKTQEEMNSLVTFTRTRIREQLKRNIWHIELGNLRSHFDEWDRQRHPQQYTLPTPTEVPKTNGRMNFTLQRKQQEAAAQPQWRA